MISPGREYYTYDTYMKLSDYNALRQMLGKEPVTLGENEYALQTKVRIAREFGDDIYNQKVETGKETLSLSRVYTEAFSQNGINGADYLIIVPDKLCDEMTPYYSVYTAELADLGSQALSDDLDEVYRHKHGILTYDEYEAAMEEGETGEDDWQEDLLAANGTDEIVVMIADLFVRDVDAAEMKFVITSVTFPLEYIALIFNVLRKLGMKKKEMNRVIFRQLALFYLAPAAAAAAISAVIVIYTGNTFVRYTGADGSGLTYFGAALLIAGGVYLLYFGATYLGFRRNVEE